MLKITKTYQTHLFQGLSKLFLGGKCLVLFKELVPLEGGIRSPLDLVLSRFSSFLFWANISDFMLSSLLNFDTSSAELYLVGIRAWDEAEVCSIRVFVALVFMPISLSNSFSYLENSFSFYCKYLSLHFSRASLFFL